MQSSPTVHRFAGFVLDEGEKRLWRGDEPLALNPRYFDALVLLVRNAGMLVAKERFFEEVWQGVIVGDEALTQCIKSLRKLLGDEHRDPRFIATVPKRGYRFVARVEGDSAPMPAERRHTTPVLLALAGTAGGGAAGAMGGVLYGVAIAGSGGSALSALSVLAALTTAIGLIGGLGVSAGMAAASLLRRSDWTFSVPGAAIGGLFVGSVFRVLGADGLHLLFGRAPQDFTGGLEGAALGVGLAAGARLGGGLKAGGWRPAVAAGIGTAVAAALIAAAGGKLLGGSLSALASAYDQSHLALDAVGRLSGEGWFGPVTQGVAAALEGLLFGMGVVGAMLLCDTRLRAPGRAAD